MNLPFSHYFGFSVKIQSYCQNNSLLEEDVGLLSFLVLLNFLLQQRPKRGEGAGDIGSRASLQGCSSMRTQMCFR